MHQPPREIILESLMDRLGSEGERLVMLELLKNVETDNLVYGFDTFAPHVLKHYDPSMESSIVTQSKLDGITNELSEL